MSKNINLTDQEFALFMHLYNRGKDDLFQEMHFNDKYDDQDIFWHNSLCDTIEGKIKWEVILHIKKFKSRIKKATE